MANWFTRALDVATPWMRGGEVVRRKKREEEEQNQNQSAPTRAPQQSGGLQVTSSNNNQRISVDGFEPKPEKPVNVFEGLNKSLNFNKPNNAVDIINREANKPIEQPKPGAVVTPSRPQPTLRVDNSGENRRITLPNGRSVDTTPAAETPESIINRGLDSGKSFEQIASENRYDINGIREYAKITRPNYGIRVERPQQANTNKIRDIFDANTEADKFRRQEGNALPNAEQKNITLENPGNIVGRTPIIGHITKALNTLGGQGAQLPALAESFFLNKQRGDIGRKIDEAEASGNKILADNYRKEWDAISERIDFNNLVQDAGYETFQKNKGGFLNTGTLYDEEGARAGDAETALKDIALPTAVAMLDLYTLGKGNTITEGIKQGGVKTGLRTQVPNIVKASAGNFASGSADAIANDGSAADATKAGILNTIFGIVPDIGLPAIASGFKNKIVPKFTRTGRVAAKDVIDELDDAAISASAEAAITATTPRPIPIRQNIPINEVIGDEIGVPVRNLTEPKPAGPMIREFPGDATSITPNPVIAENVAQIRKAEAQESINATTPNKRTILASEGLVPTPPKYLGEASNVKQIEIDTERAMLDEALANKEINKTQFKEANKALDETLASDAELPKGKPIEVKQVSGIDVIENTNVPQNLPETPGTVRATTATAPSNVKSEAVANAPVVNTPASLPKEVQNILDNPKQFTKRQVASARNQRKLARQMAKVQEDTAEAMSRIETASPAKQSSEGFVQTGKFGKSENGGAYEKVSRATERAQAVQETSQMSPDDIIQTARKNQGETGGFTKRDMRNIRALVESKRIVRGTPEWQEARQILKEDGTVWGQTGALRNYTMRRTASTPELISRYESKLYKLADDPTKIESKWFDEVEAAQDTYVVARDNATKAYNEFTRDPSSANAKAYHTAMDAADKADRAAKQVEYTVADKALKGNKDTKQVKELQKMAQEADLYQMDAVDASMLSGTATFLRNFVNASVGGIEETIFGKGAAKLASLTKRSRANNIKVGGGAGRGSLEGFGKGVDNVVSASTARAKNAGWNPLEHIKNWSTTGNQLGDTVMEAQAFRNTLDHYRSVLKSQGYKGTELTDRAGVMSRADPDNVMKEYQGVARVSAGLGQGITRNNKIESIVSNLASDAAANIMPRAAADNLGKLTARMTVGFPTAIARSTVEGVKRFTLGAPTFAKALRESDPLKRAILVKEGIKQAGTGAVVIPPLFYALGANGMITGSYPDDEEERARWEREGISENAIKIGGAYYQLPAYLGAWAVPGLFYASLGRNGGDIPAATADVVKSIPDVLPLDMPINKLNDVLNGRSDAGDFLAQTGASVVRSSTPAGALLNQIAKSFDPTKNDTNSGTTMENFIDKVVSGIPGQNKFADIPDKLDDEGNPIMNPNALQIAAGATSAVQGKGEEQTAKIQGEVADALKGISDLGALSDQNLKGILSEEDAKLYDKAVSGGELKEKELASLKEALVKGVSSEGTDTAYLEKGQYDTNITALKMKRELMNADPTTKPSSLKDIDTAIKRGEIYKEKQVPYEDITEYKDISLEEWRNLGDPEDDSYDPEAYQRLWELDQLMTGGGVSYGKKLDKNKYYAKDSGKGKGSGSGSRKMSTDFGKLTGGTFAPKVQQYATIDAKSGNIPIIRTVRPNIVHKITSSR